jgi:hypothetical protein
MTNINHITSKTEKEIFLSRETVRMARNGPPFSEVLRLARIGMYSKPTDKEILKIAATDSYYNPRIKAAKFGIFTDNLLVFFLIF